ncbi:hypothetical protein CAAN1_07S02982 [[Candida] anglica]|uniref:Flo11 domain-containing protein n=1 Tax=[Candida] anglica TaxID=148631 RepID=A0ABP0EBB7_9ASCO
MKFFSSTTSTVTVAVCLMSASAMASLNPLFGSFVDLVPNVTASSYSNLTIFKAVSPSKKRNTRADVEKKDLQALVDDVLKATFVLSDVVPVVDDVFKIVGNFETVAAGLINTTLGPLLQSIEVIGTGLDNEILTLTSDVLHTIDNIAQFSFAVNVKAQKQEGKNVYCLPDTFGIKYVWSLSDELDDAVLGLLKGVLSATSVYNVISTVDSILTPLDLGGLLDFKREDSMDVSKRLDITDGLVSQLKGLTTKDSSISNYCFSS